MKSPKKVEIYDADDDKNSEKEWEVEKILKERPRRRKNPKTGKMEFIKEYLVKWAGYKNPSWEPEENLEHSKELLKDFLITELMKTVKKKNLKSPQKAIINGKIDIIQSTQKGNKKRKRSQQSQKSPKSDDPSSFSNCLTNNTFPNKSRKNSRKKEKKVTSLTVWEENEENNYFDIEIVDDKKEEVPKIENNNIFEQKKLKIESIKKKKEISPIIGKKKTEMKNIIINAKDKNDEGKISETIYIDGIDDEDGDLYDFMEKNDNKILKKINDDFLFETPKRDKSTTKFLEMKRHIDIHENILNDKNIKIISINSLNIPERYEDKIKLNVKYVKNNKIYSEEFDSEKIPYTYLFKYYEIFMKEYFSKGNYYQEVCFD